MISKILLFPKKPTYDTQNRKIPESRCRTKCTTTNATTHLQQFTFTQLNPTKPHVHKLLWGMLLESWTPLRIPSGIAVCQVLNWNKVKCLLQLKHSHRQQSSNQAVRTTYIFLPRHQLQHKCPLQANWRTWRHAQSSLASFTFHLSTMSSRDESIRAAWCNRRAQWVIPASQTGCPCFKSLATLEIDSYPDGSCKWNRPFTRGGQLLTLRERGSSPLAWLDEYKLTYSPSPPSSFALSLYEKKGGTQTQAWGSWEGHKAFGNRQSVTMWLKRRAWLAEVWYCRVSCVFSTSLSAGPPGGTGVCYLYRYQHILATWTCSASCSTGIL